MSSQKIIPPEFEVVPMNNWDLSDLKKTFVIPEFQRRVDRNHIKLMVEAIKKNEFYDIVFSGVRRKDGKIILINGQHRLFAFIKAYEEHEIKKYNFVLIVYDEKTARRTYTRLNKGKKTQPQDDTLALDDGKIPFFNELAPYCFHYRGRQKISYIEVLGAWNYATTKKPSLRQDSIEQTVRCLDKDAVEFLKTFIKTMTENAGAITGNNLYSAIFFKNIARIALENKLSGAGIASLIRKVQRSKIPEDFLKFRSNHVMAEVYVWMNKLLEGKKK